jgi:amidohydrolase
MPVKNRFAELLPEITAWRRDLHEHPELQFDTHRTAAVVAGEAEGVRLRRGRDRDRPDRGRGRDPGEERPVGAGRGLRADMDALPILERTGVAYASTTPGAMHACGHDGHTAMLLGAARYLAETRNFDGTVAVIFQPAEEGGGGGREMVNDGMMERFGIQEVYGMHNWPGKPVGSFAIRSGPFFAAADLIEIEVTGKGAHAAKPHDGVDTTVVASHIVLALQSIVARNVDPVKQAVVSITSFETDTTAFNVIPGGVLLKGTVRTHDPAVQDLIEERMRRIVEMTAAAYGATRGPCATSGTTR